MCCSACLRSWCATPFSPAQQDARIHAGAKKNMLGSLNVHLCQDLQQSLGDVKELLKDEFLKSVLVAQALPNLAKKHSDRDLCGLARATCEAASSRLCALDKVVQKMQSMYHIQNES